MEPKSQTADKAKKVKTPTRKARRQYTEEFKAGAIRLVMEEDQSVSQVARSLGIHRSLVDVWVRQAKIDAGKGRPNAVTSNEKEELTRLRRENRILKMERAILVKAAAFFAKENA
jgi:transposase